MSAKTVNGHDYYVPLDQQMKFHLSPAMYKVYGGSMGGGKSRAICEEALQLCMDFPGITGVVCRATMPELRNTTMMVWEEEVMIGERLDLLVRPNAVTNQQKMITKFKNGSTIIWTSTDKDNIDKIKSMNLGFVCIDEATEIGYDIFLVFKTRLRQKLSNGKLPAYTIAMATNPEPGWIKTKFIDRKLYTCPVCVQNGRKDPTCKSCEQPHDYVFIQALPRDNFHLPADYEARFAGFPEEWIRKYLEGDWTVFEGQIYTNYSDGDNCCVPFIIPKAWKHYRIIDYGYTNPFACLWIAVDGDGNAFVYQEHYESNMEVPDHCNKILMMSDPEIEYEDICDPSMTAKNRVLRGKQASIIDEVELYSNEKIMPTPGTNTMTGTHRVNQWFKDKRIWIFEWCKNTRREVMGLRYKKPTAADLLAKHKPETEVDKDNHTTDCLKYFANWVNIFDVSTDQKTIDKEVDRIDQWFSKYEDKITGYVPIE